MANTHVLSHNNLERLPNKKSSIYVYIVSIVAAIGGLLFGFDTGVISGTMPFVTEHFNLNAHQEGFAVSNLIIGCIIGASCAGVISSGVKKFLFYPLFSSHYLPCFQPFPEHI